MTEVIALHISDFVHPESSPGHGLPGVVMGFAIRHDRGVVLFDTGIGTSHPWIDANYQPRSRPIDMLLNEAGIEVSDVVAVVNSHLHFDHIGQNHRFADLPTYVQRAEYDAAVEGYTVTEWVDFPGADLQLLDSTAEILPGVSIFPTPGHTVGHQSLVIETAEERTVVAGQAVYTVAEWEGATDQPRSGEPSAWNREAYRRSVQHLRELRPDHVLLAHDPTGWSADPYDTK